MRWQNVTNKTQQGYYNTKTDEIKKSYKGKYPLALRALPLEGGENYLF
jgi:hypothetical protein